jgi:hypothetical protein
VAGVLSSENHNYLRVGSEPPEAPSSKQPHLVPQGSVTTGHAARRSTSLPPASRASAIQWQPNYSVCACAGSARCSAGNRVLGSRGFPAVGSGRRAARVLIRACGSPPGITFAPAI